MSAHPPIERDRETADLSILEALQSLAPVGLGFVDQDLRIVRCNPTLAAIVGLDGEPIGRLISDVVPDSWALIGPVLTSVVETGEAVIDIELETSSDLANPRYVLASFSPLVTDGAVIGIGLVVVDVTERRQSEVTSRFQSDLLSVAGHAVIAMDLDRVILFWNRAAEEMYGWTAAEAIGRRSNELLPRPDDGVRTEAVLDAMRNGQTWSGDYDVQRRDGTTVCTWVTQKPLLDLNGNLEAVVAVAVDVTERRSGEIAQRQLSAIVDGSGDAILGLSREGLITNWNGAAQAMFGYTAEEIVGVSARLLAPPWCWEEQLGLRSRLLAGGPPERKETVRIRKDGTAIDILLTASTTTDADGNVAGMAVIMQDISERLAATRALQTSRQRLAEAQRTAHLGSFEFDVATGELSWSDEYYRILRLDHRIRPSTAVFMTMVHTDDRPCVEAAWNGALHEGRSFDLEFRITAVGDAERTVHSRAVAESSSGGQILRLTGTMADITERIEADRIRRAAETRFEIGFEQSAIGAVITDLQGIPTRVNSAVCAILGRSPEELLGRRWTEFAPPGEVWESDAVHAREVLGEDTLHHERRYLRPDGSIVWTSCHVSLVRDEAGAKQYNFVQLQDITERKMMELELAHQAVHDALTGLPNRALLTDRLDHGLAGTRRRHTRIAVMFIDLDRFKLVNDSAGHEVGDRLLQTIAARIVAAVRPGDTVARFGGDEFVVVCDDVTRTEAERIATRVHESVRQPVQIGEQELHASISLGLAISDRSSTSASLLRDADAAMYLAKERGRSRIEVFGETLRAKAAQRWVTTTELHRALERNELSVYYQPVIDITTGAMVSAEALVRWQHPDRGLVGPVEFIPFAEETGLVVPIGAWVLEEACRQLCGWQRLQHDLGHSSRLSLAVNLSVRQLLAPDIVEVIRGVLGRTGICPADLSLELTESVFMEDADHFGRVLGEIKATGVDLAIDDFGTGYSSLSYLKRFPVDAVKIDRAFVDGLGTDPHDTALVAAIVAMAGALGLSLVAEGAETTDQLAELAQLGVRHVQGFVLARPMPADELTLAITTDRRWPAA